MAFAVSDQATRRMKAVGAFTEIFTGMVTMAAGTGTVTIPELSFIEGIIGMVQGATGVGETVICTDITNNVATLETIDEAGNAAGTSVVMWMAWGKGW